MTARWVASKKMHTPRSHHSSCSLGKNVYVFCGRNYQYTMLNSIEWLNAEADASGETVGWLEIPVHSSVGFKKRFYALAAPVDTDKILIGGGLESIYDFMSDKFILNTTTNVLEKQANGFYD